MSDSRQPLHSRLIILFLIPILIGGIGLVVDYLDGFSDLREHVRGQTIPDILVKSGRTGKEIRLLEYKSIADFALEGFDRDLAPTEMPSTSILKAVALQSELPTLSVVSDPDDLLDRNTGLIANPSKRGRSWERPTYVSYFENGELKFAAGAGLRIHGGRSRSMLAKSFRLYFRELYGLSYIPPGVLFNGEGDPIRSIVIHNDLRIEVDGDSETEWHFVNPLAYDLARDIGCITPSTRPVQFYLNGVYQGPYVLTEHISADYLVSHYGHSDFVFARLKPNKPKGSPLVETGDRDLFIDLQKWAQSSPAPLNMREVEKKIDLANLTNWMISILYSAVTDPFQGAALLDQTDPNARWFWVNWDMDHAFMDWYDQEASPWEIDSFAGYSGVLKQPGKARSVIFNRLRLESPEYRKFFLRRMTEVLNHIFTPAKVSQKLKVYRDISNSFEISDNSYLNTIEDFIQYRPAVLRRQMNTYFDSGDSYRLSVHANATVGMRIDGYDVGATYTGYYFSSTPARIEILDNEQGFVGVWIVNGKEQSVNGAEMELYLTSDTTVEIGPLRTRTNR